MKIKYYIIVTGILVSLGFMSCSGDEPAYGESIADNMRINQNYSGDLNFDKNHEEYVDIGASAGLPWNLYTSESWISVSPTSGVGPQQVKVTVMDNDKTTSRHGYIRVHSMRFDKEDDISVSQAGSYLKITNSTGEDVTASNSYSNYQTTSVVGETQKYSIETNANWEVAYFSPSSLVVEPKSGKPGITNIQVKSTANTGSYTTYPEIQFKTAASDKYYLNLKQAAPYFNLFDNSGKSVKTALADYDYQLFDASGETKDFKIQTNSTWEAVYSPDWITVTPPRGNPGDNISFKVEASKYTGTSGRSGYIRFLTLKSSWDYLYVKQEPEKELSIRVGNDGKYKAAGDYWFMYINDIPSGQYWTARLDKTWTHFSTKAGPNETSGYGTSNTVKIYVDENTSTSSNRTATLTVTSKGKSKAYTITQGYYSKYSDWTSNNTDINSSSTNGDRYLYNVKKGDELTFNWRVSSEGPVGSFQGDTFTATLLKNGSTVKTLVNGVSGSKDGSAYHKFTSSGDYTLRLVYKKDSSVSMNDDKAYATNIKVDHIPN